MHTESSQNFSTFFQILSWNAHNLPSRQDSTTNRQQLDNILQYPKWIPIAEATTRITSTSQIPDTSKIIDQASPFNKLYGKNLNLSLKQFFASTDKNLKKSNVSWRLLFLFYLFTRRSCFKETWLFDFQNVCRIS